ncbi:MAG: prepilin-type N-terminal cleavage/methylation domain-containing protein [Candidatus Altimarinota bacterium]
MRAFHQPFLRKPLRGFSLAEVLIAIVIIAILTIGSLAVYSSQIAKARDTERRNDVTRIKGLLDTVIGEYGAPPGEDVQSRKLKQVEDCKVKTKLLDCFKELRVSTEDDLDNLFADPSQGIQNDRVEGERLYGYLFGSNRNSFKICAMLEDQGSSDLNTQYSGAADPARSENDKLYCIDNIVTGGEPINEVVRLEHPFDE